MIFLCSSVDLNSVQMFLPCAILIKNDSEIRVQMHCVLQLFINPFPISIFWNLYHRLFGLNKKFGD